MIPYWGFCSELGGCVRVVYISGAHHELSFSRTSQLAPWGGAPPRNRGSVPSSSGKDQSLRYMILQFPRVAFKSLEKKPLGFQAILRKGFQSWPALLAYLPDIRHQIWPEFSFENISTLVTPILLIAKPKPSLWPARPPVIRHLPRATSSATLDSFLFHPIPQACSCPGTSSPLGPLFGTLSQDNHRAGSFSCVRLSWHGTSAEGSWALG